MAQISLRGSGFFITDNQTSFSQIFVPVEFQATNFTVSLNTLNHTRVGDLTITLFSPTQSQTIFRFNSDGSFVNATYVFGNNFTASFEEAISSTPDGFVIPGGNYYAPFNSQLSRGNWQLAITDNVFQNNGGLFSWDLNLNDNISVPSNSTAVPLNFNSLPGIIIIFIICLLNALARSRF